MDRDLEAKINERKRQARENRIAHKAYVIGTVLGRELGQWSPGCQRRFLYQSMGVDILAQRDKHDHEFAQVLFDDRPVFKGSSEITSRYIPGGWETLLEELYSTAQEQKRVLLEQNQSQENYAVREPWGL